MNKALDIGAAVLADAGYSVRQVILGQRDALVFEGETVIGFVFSYGEVSELLQNWQVDSNLAVSNYQFLLRRAGVKAWNTYLILLAEGQPDHAGVAKLSAVEEDLTGTRKIVRAGVSGPLDVSGALLPLLPLQAAPRLEGVDIKEEIKSRAKEVPARAVEAFFSDAEDALVLQVLEETT